MPIGNPQDILTTPYGYSGQVAPETAVNLQNLNRRRLIANMLMQQGMQPQQGQMVGRFYVPAGLARGFAGLGSTLAGALLAGDIDKKSSKAVEDDEQMVKRAIAEAMASQQGQSEPPPQPQPAPMPEQPFTGQVGATPMPEPGVQSAQPPIPATPPQSQAGIEGMAGLDMANVQPADMSAMVNSANPDMAQAQAATAQTLPQAEPPAPAVQPPPAMPDPTAQPGRPSFDAIASLMTNQHPRARAYGQFLAQMAQREQEREDTQTFNREQRALDRDVRREGIEMQTMARLEQMRNTNQLMQMQIEERIQRGQDATDLKKQQMQLQAEQAKLQADLQRDRDRQASSDRRSHDETLKAIAGMNQQAKQDAKEEKKQLAMEQDRSSLETIQTSLDGLITNATALKNHPGLSRITGVMGAFPNMPGSDAANAQALLESLRSKTAVGAIQDMRSMSKTGGAVGQVTEKEWPRLENLYQALNTAQSPEAFKQALDDLVGYAQESKGRIQGSFDRKYGGSSAPSQPSATQAGGPARITSDAEFDALPSGTTFIGPDGKTRRKP